MATPWPCAGWRRAAIASGIEAWRKAAVLEKTSSRIWQPGFVVALQVGNAVPVVWLAGGEDAGCAFPQPNRYTASNAVSPQHIARRIIFDLCIFFISAPSRVLKNHRIHTVGTLASPAHHQREQIVHKSNDGRRKRPLPTSAQPPSLRFYLIMFACRADHTSSGISVRPALPKRRVSRCSLTRFGNPTIVPTRVENVILSAAKDLSRSE